MDAMQPEVSIVLPTHNRANMLPAAVESILGQDFEDWELIIVDDASSDQTPTLIADFSARDPRIRSIRNDPNLRLPRSLNRGFAEAKGRLLTWTSDDNRYYPNALTTLVNALHAAPEAGLVYSSMRIVDEQGALVRDFAALPVEDQPVQPWVGACFLYRREVYDAVGGYDPDAVLAEDLDYWIRARIKFPMRAVPEVLYDYLDHPDSLSTKYLEKVQEASSKVVEKHLAQIGWLTKVNRAKTLLGLAEAHLRSGDRSAARKRIREAMSADSKTVMSSFKRGILKAFLGI